MLLVCSTYASVMCMYCVLFDLRRKLKVANSPRRESSEERKRHSQPNSRYYGRKKYGTMNCTNKKPVNITMIMNITMLHSIK